MGVGASRTHAATPTPVKHKRSDTDSDAEDVLFEVRGKSGNDLQEATWLLDQKDQKDVEGDEEKPKYPRSVIFIMGNEFCERFSYYGMRAVLTLYLTQVLLFTESTATVVYHSFTMLCYFTPLFGAILSDTTLGKFRTIFYLSILYAFGNVVLSTSSIPVINIPHLAFSMVGLVLIGIGTGGIKPCVAAFGGDQFADSQEKERQQFFSIFYFSINAGSLLSTFITPVLRADVTCFEQETCFALAFGLPAILMVVAVLFFVAGKPLYKILPPQGNVVLDVVKCVSHAISRRCKINEKREHWVDYADDKYDSKLIEDVKAVLRVLFMYLPLPFFWALFDQQGSRWTLQATRMDGYISFLGYAIKPDQMQVVNPFMILLMIPIFEGIVYPLFAKCHLLTRPLQRISVGGLLAGASFVVAGFVQLAIEATFPVHPAAGHADVALLNMMPCSVNVTIVEMGDYIVPPFTNLSITEQAAASFHGSVGWDKGCPIVGANNDISFQLEQKKVSSLALGLGPDGSVFAELSHESREKAEKGRADIRLVYNFMDAGDLIPRNSTILIKPVTGKKNHNFTYYDTFNSTEYQLVDPDEYDLYLPDPNNPREYLNESFVRIELGQGAAYTLLLFVDKNGNTTTTLITDVAPNTLSMFLQIPQYLIITLGEIMFSITGLEFSYSQAPASMKSVLQAAWLLTVAFGNLIVVIVAEAEFFEKQSYEFFLFAGLMTVDMVIFIIMSLSYVYVKSPSELASELADDLAVDSSMDSKTLKEKEAAGVANQGFEADTKF